MTWRWDWRNRCASKFAAVAFQADEGEVFGPVHTKHGFNIGQVVEIKRGKQLSFEQAKERLEADMNNQRRLSTWRDWLAEQITAADVDYAEAYRPDNPDAPPTEEPSR